MDDALDPGGMGGAQQGNGAVDIGAQHGIGVRHPDAVVGGDMHHKAAPGHRPGERGGVAQVTLDNLQVEPREVAPVAAGAA